MKKTLLAIAAVAGLGTTGLVAPETGIGMSAAKAETVSSATKNNKPVSQESSPTTRAQSGTAVKIKPNLGSLVRQVYSDYSPLYDRVRIERAKRNQFRNRKR